MPKQILYPEEVKELNTNKLLKETDQLTLNCIMCLHCNDIIVSLHHSLKRCKCGKVAINGGKDYLRRTGLVGKDYEELSIWKP